MPSNITKTKHTQSQVFIFFHDEYMNINVTFVTANLAEGEILGITLKWACGLFAVRGGSQRMSINVPHHHDPHQTSYSCSLHPVDPQIHNTQIQIHNKCMSIKFGIYHLALEDFERVKEEKPHCARDNI